MELYIVNIHTLRDGEGLSLLPPERRAHAQRFYKKEDRLRSLAAGHLLRYALGERQNALLTTETGKLYLANGPHFNLSHSGDFVILGVSAHTVGVDIERIAPYDRRVAVRCYTKSELLWLEAEHTDSAFYKLWTAKESIMKATGQGFRMPPESFSVLPIADGAHTVHGNVWHLKWSALPDHMICTACEKEEDITEIFLSKDILLS